MSIHSAVITGCAPGSTDCNQAPPLDGWITFWAPIVGVAFALVVIATAVAFYRKRARSKIRST